MPVLTNQVPAVVSSAQIWPGSDVKNPTRKVHPAVTPASRPFSRFVPVCSSQVPAVASHPRMSPGSCVK